MRTLHRAKACLRALVALSGAAAFLLTSALEPKTASAQGADKDKDKPAQSGQPPPDGGEVSVPKGGAGAVIVAPKEQPPAPASKARDPRVLNFKQPEYPPEALAAGLKAEVRLYLTIDKFGNVTKAGVVQPAGHGFDESAVAAAMELKFDPALNDAGNPVAVKNYGYRYAFDFKEKEPAPGEPPAATKRAQGLSGVVLITGSDTGIAGAGVTVTGPAGERHAATTDADGRFDLRPLPPGAYQVRITATGFDPLEVSETLAQDESIDVKYRIAASGGGLEVVVRGDRPPREVTKRTLEKREIDRIPGTNGDALKSLQNLPGVARPPAIAGLLIVRGSAPQDTHYYIDGIEVPIIYHFGGLSSVVPTEMLQKIDFYPGNFSTQYGRGMGGIVEVGLRSPKDDGKYHGVVQLDLIDGRAIVEGPIPLLKDWNFIAAGRRSWFDAWLGPILSSASGAPTQAPVYYDYQFLAEHDTSTSRLRVGFIGSDDGLKLLVKDPSPGEPAISGDLTFHTAFQRLSLRYDSELSSKDRVAGTVALGRDSVDFGIGPIFFTLATNSIFGRAEYSHRYLKGVTINTGLDIQATQYSVNARLPTPPRPGEPPNQPFSTRPPIETSTSGATVSPAAYAELELTPDERSRIVPGIRADYDNLTKRGAVSPRFNARYDLVHEYPRTTLKTGIGVFHQPPAPQQAIAPLGTPGLLPNRAIHYAVGVEQELTRQLEISVEGFYKQMDELVIARASPSGAGLTYDNAGTGKVLGGEVLLKYKPDARFFGWLSYTLSRATRIDGPGQDQHLFPFDQTHILTVLGSYRLGHGWEFGMRFRLISGSLTTPNVCDPAQTTCDPYRTNALWNSAGVYTAIPFSGSYSERLPMFHQLDIRVDKRWKFKTWQLSGYLDVQNVYNQANAEGIDYNFNYTARRYVTGLPLIPNLGLRADF